MFFVFDFLVILVGQKLFILFDENPNQYTNI